MRTLNKLLRHSRKTYHFIVRAGVKAANGKHREVHLHLYFGFFVNKHFKGFKKFCLFQQLPDLVSDNKPTELSGYRIIDLGFFQKSLKSCQLLRRQFQNGVTRE